MYWRAFPIGSRHISVRFYVCETHNVLPLLCFNVQTEMRFWVEQLLFPEGRRCKKELFYSKPHFSLYVKAKQRRYIVCFTHIKSNWNMSRSDWKCSPVHKYWLNQSKWTYSTQTTEGTRYLYPRVGMHRQAIFESKGDKLSSSAECRIRTQRVSGTE